LEFIGYTVCDQNYWLQKGLLLVGEGSNGKSTFLKIVEALAGRENTSFLSIGDLHQETTRSGLEGKLVNISDELPNYSLKNTEMFKKLMGGSATARKLYQDAGDMDNTAKFIFSCNELPMTTDVSHGMFRRLAIVPFAATFKMGDNADVFILDRMRAELPGIFNRVYRHYQKLKKRGNLIESVRSNEELARYQEGVDRVGTWIKENLRWNGKWDDTVGFVKINDVFENYHSDCKRSEEKPVSKDHFTRHLHRQLDHFNERYVRRADGDDRPYVLRGVWFDKDKTKGHDRY
jgi:putative DNA primase/helicase